MSEMGQFKQYIQNKLEKTLEKCPNLGYETDDDGNEIDPGCAIAQTTFAFRNHDLIALLKERGYYIDNQMWKEVEQTNGKITELMKDQETLDRFQEPCGVFV